MQVIEKTYFSKKIVLLNWILTMLIVLLHGNPVIRFGLDMNTDSTIFIKLLFSACQVAVPLFFLISAILFYRTCTKFDDLKSKLRRRIKSLLIPYLLWNTLFVGIFFLLPRIPVIGEHMNMGIAVKSWIDVFWGIIDSRFTPLWFVKQLMFYTALSPLVYVVVRNKYVFTFIYILSIIVSLSIDTTIYDSFFLWLPIYLIGAFIGYHRLEIKGSRLLILMAAAILVSLYCLILWDYYKYLTLFRIMTPALLWYLTDWIAKNIISIRFSPKKWMMHTFFIYCAHHFCLNVVIKFAVIYLEPTPWVLNVTFISAFLIVAVGLTVFAEWFSKFRVYSILTGGR